MLDHYKTQNNRYHHYYDHVCIVSQIVTIDTAEKKTKMSVCIHTYMLNNFIKKIHIHLLYIISHNNLWGKNVATWDLLYWTANRLYFTVYTFPKIIYKVRN